MKEIKNSFVVIGALFFSSIACADELNSTLNGTVHDNGNGHFSIQVQNDEGHVFTGSGIDQGDGTLFVVVKDANGVTYRGRATNNDDSEYILTLNDVATGTPGHGILEEK